MLVVIAFCFCCFVFVVSVFVVFLLFIFVVFVFVVIVHLHSSSCKLFRALIIHFHDWIVVEYIQQYHPPEWYCTLGFNMLIYMLRSTKKMQSIVASKVIANDVTVFARDQPEECAYNNSDFASKLLIISSLSSEQK